MTKTHFPFRKLSSKTKQFLSVSIAVLPLCFAPIGDVSALDLKGTIFEQAGKEYNVDPELLYSIALVESAIDAKKKGHIQPSPWTLRTNKPFYGKNKEETQKELERLLKNRISVDIGMMQINSKWHGHRVKNITELLDPLTNVRVGAEILSEQINRYPKDAVRAIGTYHSTDKDRAVWYANHVLRVYSNIKDAGKI